MNTKAGRKAISLQNRDISLIRMLAKTFGFSMVSRLENCFPWVRFGRRNFRLKQLRDAGYLSSRELIRMGNVAKHGYYLGPRAPSFFSNPTNSGS